MPLPTSTYAATGLADEPATLRREGMPLPTSTYVGIDLAATSGITEVVCLTCSPGQTLPVFDLARQRPVKTDAEICAAALDYAPQVIAIDAPLSLPACLTCVAPPCAGCPPENGRYFTRAAERDPFFRTMPFKPMAVVMIASLTFRGMYLKQRLLAAQQSGSPAPVIEVYPRAAYWSLGIITSREEQRKTHIDARRQVQQGLANLVSGIPAVTDQVVGADLLDAIVAALSAYYYATGRYRALGEATEGQIIIPV